MRSSFALFDWLVLVLSVALLSSPTAHGQATVGIQRFGAYDNSPDTVDLGSLGLHLEIPLFVKGGRGQGTSLSFALNNFTSYTVQQTTDSAGKIHPLNVGPGLSLGFSSAGSLTSSSQTHNCTRTGLGTYTDTVYQYTDGRGNVHFFAGHTRSVYNPDNSCSAFTPSGMTAQAADGSGYLISIPTPPANAGLTTVTTPSGSVYSEFGLNDPNALTIVDANGNRINLVLGTTGCTGWYPCMDNYGNLVNFKIQDTLNTTSLQVTGGGYSTDFSSRNPLLITYLDDTGNPQTISFNYRMYPWGTSTVGILDNVSYPDGSSYRFTYVLGSNGGPTTNPPAIASITLPTGGTITYGYPGGITTCNINPTYVPTLTRTTSDGTTTYSRTITSEGTTSPPHCAILNSYTTISKPNGDQTKVYFVVPQQYALFNPNSLVPMWTSDMSKTFETKRLEYDHSNLNNPLRTTMRCYDGATGDCTTSAVNEPVTQLAVTSGLPPESAGSIIRNSHSVSPGFVRQRRAA